MAADPGQYTTMTIAVNCPVEILAENMLEHLSDHPRWCWQATG